MNQYRKSPRANFIDYDSGDYFITICTKEKLHFFGEISGGVMLFSEIGSFVDSQLRDVRKLTDSVDVLQYVVMPNHIHAIIRILDNRRCSNIGQRSPNPSLRDNPEEARHIPTLSSYISSLKGAVTKFAKNVNPEFGWQSRYHDHLIRGRKDCDNIAEYIRCNVDRWEDDCFNQ